MSSTPNSTVEASTTSSSPASCMASNNNAPKYGTRVPNRVFVGGLSGDTTEAEMEVLFSNYGQVSSAKIISDRAGVSKGYGFITFETEEQARNLLKMSEVYLKNRKLNIAPAIKKQYDVCGSLQSQYGRSYDAPSPSVPSGSVYYSSAGVPYTFQNNGVSYYPAAAAAMVAAQQEAYNAAAANYAASQPQAQAASGYSGYPYIYPATQAVYAPQQYSYQTMPPPALPEPNTTVMYTTSPTPPNSSIASPILSPSLQTQLQQQHTILLTEPGNYAVNSPVTAMSTEMVSVAADANNGEDINTVENVEEPQQVLYNMGQLIVDPTCFSTPPPPTYILPMSPTYNGELVSILNPPFCSFLPPPIWSPFVPPPYIPEHQFVSHERAHFQRRGRGGYRGGRGRGRYPRIGAGGDCPSYEAKTRRDLPPRMHTPRPFKQQDYTPINTPCPDQMALIAMEPMCNNNNNDKSYMPPDLVKMVQALQINN